MKLVVIVVKEHKTQKHTQTSEEIVHASWIRDETTHINESKLYTITREKKQKTQNKTDKFKIILILNNQISK